MEGRKVNLEWKCWGMGLCVAESMCPGDDDGWVQLCYFGLLAELQTYSHVVQDGES